jgi:hypothetical protein
MSYLRGLTGGFRPFVRVQAKLVRQMIGEVRSLTVKRHLPQPERGSPQNPSPESLAYHSASTVLVVVLAAEAMPTAQPRG